MNIQCVCVSKVGVLSISFLLRLSSGSGGKVPKQLSSQWKENLASHIPVKKSAKKTSSLDDMPREKSEPVQKQKSEPEPASQLKVKYGEQLLCVCD